MTLSPSSQPELDLLALLELIHTDLTVLQPGYRDARESARLVGERLPPDRMVYLLASPLVRGRTRRGLAREGLVLDGVFLHLPNVRSTRAMFPLTRRASRAVLLHGGGQRSIKRRLLARAATLPGGAGALATVLPQVGLVFRRPEGSRSFSWLFETLDKPPMSRLTTILASWRGAAGGAVVVGWSDDGSEPVVVAKAASNGGASLSREAAALASLGASARAAGALIPEVRASLSVGHSEILVEDPVPGRPMTHLLREDAARLPPLLGELVGWLGRWHEATARLEPLTVERLDALLRGPAADLADDLEPVAGYARYLSRLAAKLEGRKAPLVATHNDLTMANVKWSEATGLGILDWDTAADDGLPLVDFFYAAVDAVQAARAVTRPEAFRECFDPAGGDYPTIASLREELVRKTDLDDDLGALAFHSCFLHHARNERRAAPGGARPFLALARGAARLAELGS